MGTNPYTPPDAPIEVENSRSDRDSRFGSRLLFFLSASCCGLALFVFGAGTFFWLAMTRAGREPHRMGDSFDFWSDEAIILLSLGFAAIGCWFGWRLIRRSAWWGLVAIMPNALWILLLIGTVLYGFIHKLG